MRYEIVVDDDPIHPRSEHFSNLGTILYTSSRYILGDKRVDREEIEDKMADNSVIVLPVYAYIHGEITLKTSAFGCIFDSGLSGCIYVSRETVLEEFKKKRISNKMREHVIDILKSEVKTYSQYLSGDVFGYRIFDDKGEEIDSCWGFFGREFAEESAQEAMQMFIKAA